VKLIKIFSVTAVLLSLSLLHKLNAQVYFGIKGSYSIPFIRSSELKYDDFQDFILYKIRFIEQDVSPTISLFTYYRNELIYLQAEVAYRRVRSKFSSIDYLNFNDLTPVIHDKETNYVVIPLTAGIRFKNFKFGAGPVISIVAKENNVFEGLDFFEERRSTAEYGFSFTLGMALYRLHIDLSYEYQFNGVGDYLYFRENNQGFQQQTQFLNIGLGFLF